jgi:hypothetical protein
VGAQDVQERRMGLPGRDLIDLVAQQPGWFLEANGSLHPRESEYQAQYIVDGFPIQDNRGPAFSPGLEADDVQSMKVYTSGIPAEYGRKLGGIIELNTSRNASPGFRGSSSTQGGSFATAGGSVSAQYTAGRTTATASGEGFLTDRYLDPPVDANFTNHGSHTGFTGTLERDVTAWSATSLRPTGCGFRRRIAAHGSWFRMSCCSRRRDSGRTARARRRWGRFPTSTFSARRWWARCAAWCAM